MDLTHFLDSKFKKKVLEYIPGALHCSFEITIIQYNIHYISARATTYNVCMLEQYEINLNIHTSCYTNHFLNMNIQFEYFKQTNDF